MAEKSLKKNEALNMTRAMMSLLFPLITFPYSSRVLGPVFIGKVNFAQSVVSYFALIAGLGIGTYGIREAAKIRDDRMKLSAFVREILAVNAVSTFVAYILLAVAMILVPQLSDYKKLLCISGASILFTTLGMDWLYSALEEFRYITVRSILFQLISLILLFTLVKGQDDYLKYAAISVVANAGSNICNFIHARKFIDLGVKGKLSVRRHIHPIFVLFASSVAVSIYTVLDTTMLGFIRGDEAVGIYTTATKIAHIVIIMITAATTVLFPRLSYYAQKNMEEEYKTVLTKAVQAVIFVSVPCAAGLFMLSEQTILIIGGSMYTAAVPVMRIMTPIILFISFGSIVGHGLISYRMDRQRFHAVLSGSCVNFVLNIFLIYFFGPEGAAVATVLAELSVSLVLMIYGRKLVIGKKIITTFIQSLSGSAVMILVLCAVKIFVSGILVQTVVSVAAGAVVYVLFMLVLRNEVIHEAIILFRRKK